MKDFEINQHELSERTHKSEKDLPLEDDHLKNVEPIVNVVTDADMDKATLCRRRMLGWIISLTVSFSGIDAIYYYSNSIYEEAGLS